MSIWVALVLITLCTILWDFSVVLQKLAVDELPRIRFDRSLPSAIASLLSSGRWLAGLAASALGWGLFVLALVYIPVSVARAIQGSGFVVLAAFSVLFLRHRLSSREWLGVALVTAGIFALGISENSAGTPLDEIAIVPLVVAFGACGLACFGAYLLQRIFRRRFPRVISFSVMAGILLGLGDVATKILILLLQRVGLAAAAVAAGLGLILVYVTGFLVLSRSYQHGRAILVTAVSDLASRLVAIVVGIGALGERLSADPLPRILGITGYALIFAGVAMLSRFSGEGIAEGLANARAPSGSNAQVLGQAEEAEGAAATKVDRDS